MSPEELAALAEAARKAIGRGASPEEVNAVIREEAGVPDLKALTLKVHESQGGPSNREQAQQRLAGQGGGALGDFARMAAQGATFGFADELAGLAAGAGAALPGGRSPGEARKEVTEASRQRVDDLRELSPVASGAAEVMGGLLVPGGIAGKAAGKGKSALGLLTGGGKSTAALGREAGERATQAISGNLGPGAVTGRALRQAGGAVRRGAVPGAAVGGLIGAGESEGSVAERAGAAASGAASGAAIGGGLGLLAGIPGTTMASLRDRATRRAERNPRIARRAEETLQEAGQETRPGAILQRQQEQRSRVSEGFKAIEDERGTSHALRTVLNQPVVRANERELKDQLRRLGQENVYDRALTDNRPIRYEDLQGIRDAMQDLVDGAFRDGNNQLGHRLANERRRLDSVVADLFDDQDLRRAWREVSMVPDALEEGSKMVTRGVDALQTAADQFTGHPEAKIAFITGAGRKIIDDMTKQGGKMRVSQDLMDRLAVVVPDEQVRNTILGHIERESRQAAYETLADFTTKALGFVVGGTSLFGGGLLSLGG